MNELLEGLEAMIRRVVKEEISDGGVLTGDNSARFVNTMKDAARRYSSEMRSIIQDHLPATPPAAAPIMAGMSTDAFGAQFASFITAAPRAFDEVVKRAVLDQPWFDEAVQAEVAEASSSSGDLTKAVVVDLINEHTLSEGRIRDIADEAAADCVSPNGFDQAVTDLVRNMDHDYFAFNDQVQTVVRDMDFSISVDR